MPTRISYTSYENGKVVESTAVPEIPAVYNEILRYLVDPIPANKRKLSSNKRFLVIGACIAVICAILLAWASLTQSEISFGNMAFPVMSEGYIVLASVGLGVPVGLVVSILIHAYGFVNHQRYVQSCLGELPELDIEDFTCLRSTLVKCYEFSGWSSVKYLKKAYLYNYHKFDKGDLHFVYHTRRNNIIWDGIILNGKHVVC